MSDNNIFFLKEFDVTRFIFEAVTKICSNLSVFIWIICINLSFST